MAVITSKNPKVEILSHDQLAPSKKTAILTTPDQYSCTWEIPSNETMDPILYTFELLIDEKSTGMLAYVTVMPEGIIIENSDVVDFWVSPDVMSSNGGVATFYINLRVAMQPTLKILTDLPIVLQNSELYLYGTKDDHILLSGSDPFAGLWLYDWESNTLESIFNWGSYDRCIETKKKELFLLNSQNNNTLYLKAVPDCLPLGPSGDLYFENSLGDLFCLDSNTQTLKHWNGASFVNLATDLTGYAKFNFSESRGYLFLTCSKGSETKVFHWQNNSFQSNSILSAEDDSVHWFETTDAICCAVGQHILTWDEEDSCFIKLTTVPGVKFTKVHVTRRKRIFLLADSSTSKKIYTWHKNSQEIVEVYSSPSSFKHFYETRSGEVFIGSEGTGGIIRLVDHSFVSVYENGSDWECWHDTYNDLVFVSSGYSTTSGVYRWNGNSTLSQVFPSGYGWKYLDQRSSKIRLANDRAEGCLIWDTSLNKFILDPDVNSDFSGQPIIFHASGSTVNGETKIWNYKRLFTKVDGNYDLSKVVRANYHFAIPELADHVTKLVIGKMESD